MQNIYPTLDAPYPAYVLPQAQPQVVQAQVVQPQRWRTLCSAEGGAKVLNGMALTFSWLAILSAVAMSIIWMVTAGSQKPNDMGEERELYGQTQTAWFQISALLFLLGIVCQLRLVQSTGKSAVL